MHKFSAMFVILLVSVVMTTVVIVRNPSDSVLGQLVRVVGSVTASVTVSLAVIALWMLTPFTHQYHWWVKADRCRLDSSGHTLLVIKSNHWHTLSKLRCTVTDRLNVKWTAISKREDQAQEILAPDENKTFDYPKDFNAPWPKPGRYRVKWQMDVVGRRKPITLARQKWQVVD